MRGILPVLLMAILALSGCATRSANVATPAVAPQAGQVAPSQGVEAGALPSAGTAPAASPASARPAAPKVALLLPLSGRDAGLGRVMLNAAQMAVFDFGDDAFSLMPIDTEPAGPAAAAQQAVANGAGLILGPIFARQVGEVASVARAAGLPVISFSSDRSVAGNGVYILGLPPSAAISRAARFALDQGVRRIATLVPADPLGARVDQAVGDIAQGGTVAPVVHETYAPGTSEFGPVLKRLASELALAAPATAQVATSGGTATPIALDAPAPATREAAIVLTENGQRLRTLAAQLPYFGIDPRAVRLIGPSLWEESGLGAVPELVGAWFAAPDPAGRSAFEQRYQAAYAKAPPRIATLAYDGVGLAAVLARAQAGAPDFSAAALSQPSGFAGVDGIFRFDASGIAERGLAILQVTPTGIQVVQPAPTSFAQPAAS